jgi:HK97 family phage prohead protease
MIELDKPQRIDKSFAITSVVEHKALTQNDMVNNDEQWIEVSGYASKMVYADSQELVIDADQENVNTWGMDLRRLKNGILPILFNHQQDKPVGSVLEATYDKDGLLIKAKIFKYKDDALTNFVYNSVKSGVIKAFSVGMLVKGFDLVEQDDEEYLQIARSEVIEISLVAVPSNHEALFRMTNLKSVDGTNKNMLLLAKSDLKVENEEACSGFSCALKKHKLEMEQKDITVDVEVKEEESKEAVLGVTPEAYDELEAIRNPPEPEPVPPVEDSIAAEGTTVTSGEADMVVDANDKPSDAPQEELEATPEPVDNIKVGIDALATIDVAQLSDEQLESLYEALSNIVDKIESHVVDAIVQEMTTVVAPAA